MTIEDFIKRALNEDIQDGDHTSMSTIPIDTRGRMQLIAKQDGIIAGINIAQQLIHIHDPDISIRLLKKDGDKVCSGDIVFYLEGRVWSLLSGERLLLNFMQRMSGIATFTNSLAEIISDLPTKILDTRKTTPNFRVFEKMAVNIGGGLNHRFGLYDMILIKDNHVDFAGGIKEALIASKNYLAKNKLKLKIEIEVRNLNELKQALETGIMNRVMFDNFSPELMKQAVNIVDNQCETEASGMINASNIRSYAETGVNYISIGALTHQIKSLDLSLKAL